MKAATIGPTMPTRTEIAEMRVHRDAFGRLIARDVVRGFVPSDLYTGAFASLDGGLKTVKAILKACR